MANIVISIHNPLINVQGRYPYFEYFVNKLSEYGNNILLFETCKHQSTYENIPNKILNRLKDFKPDLFIFMNNHFWDISKDFDVPIVVYDVDSPNVYSNIENLKQNVDRYKFFTITSSGSELIQKATNAKDKNICYIPPFTGVTSNNLTRQDINIGFCGSHWLWNDFTDIYDFIKRKPSKKDRLMAKKVLDEYIKNPTTTFDEIYSNFNFSPLKKISENTLYNFSTRLSGIKRLRCLTELADLGLEIRGHYWDCWQALLTVFPEVMLCYSPEVINNLETTQNFYNSCKIGLNTIHIHAKNGFSWRVADILASNACLVTQKSKDLSDLGFNLPTYESNAEARELCIKLLNDDNYRNDLVLHSQDLINKKHRFEHILPIIEDFIQIKLSNKNKEGSIRIHELDIYFNSITLEKILTHFNKVLRIIRII